MIEERYKDLSKRWHKKARQKRFPIRVLFELTYICNHKCIHCYNTDEQKKAIKKELKTKQVFKILDQLKEIGCFYLGFTGGEIFTRPDALKIISYAKRLGFEVIILTNASLINKKIVNELAKLKINKVDITLHAIDNEIFNQITGIRGSGKKVFNAIKMLHEKGVPLGLKSCGMEFNKKEIIKISKFARSLDTIYRFDGELTPRQDGSKKPLNYSISLKDVYELRKKCYPEMYQEHDAFGKKKAKSKSRRDFKKLFNCGAGYSDLTISPYGEAKICIEIDYLKCDILKHGLKKCWQEIKDFVDNLKPPKNWQCKKCEFSAYCSWCPAKSWLENGDFATCDYLTKQRAMFSKKMDKK